MNRGERHDKTTEVRTLCERMNLTAIDRMRKRVGLAIQRQVGVADLGCGKGVGTCGWEVRRR